MTDEDVTSALTEVFHEVFFDEDLQLHPAMSAKDVQGWDSLRNITLVIAVEKRFSIKISSREMDKMKNVGDLVAVIARKVNDRAS